MKYEDKFENEQTKPPCDGFGEKCQSCKEFCPEKDVPDDAKEK